ncbi:MULTISPECIES: hypothetical protein [Parachlamydia]|jgi:hypothetical protein|uniref:hypothetical protein n=1 Tax=Parachlamydia TaxID=83551 RepID=UPI0001C17A8E|nr:hypothetical protein [Parachlamydia acanthamoebae]EFB42040.1 hypothetical protein pah_c016o090 [Parachlamydia acanthamoebae str. Hall's coccus]
MKFIFLLFILIPFLLCANGIEDAQTYHHHSTLQWRIAMETIDLIPWNECDNVLDVGCGDGKRDYMG